MRHRRWLKGAAWAGGIVALLAATYLLVGYYAVPRLLRHAAENWSQDTLHKPMRIGEIRTDPLRFTLDIQDIAIPADPRPMLAADRIHVRFSFLSLLHGPYTFDEVRLERPVVRAVVRPDRSLNLGDLAPKPQKAKAGGRAVRIGTFAIARGQLGYTDQSLPGQPEMVLSPVAFTLRDFQTDAAAGGAFSLHGHSELGEALAWTGVLSASPLHSRGRVQVTALRPQTLGAFLGPSLPASLQGGLLDLGTAYDVHAVQGGLKLDLTGADLGASGLQAKGLAGPAQGASAAVDRARARLDHLGVTLAARQAPAFQATLPTLAVDGLSLAAPGQSLRVKSAALAGVTVDSASNRLGAAGLTLDGVTLTAPGQPVRVRSAALTEVAVDGAAHRINAGGLVVDGAEATVRRGADGRLSLASLTPKASPAARTQTPSQAPPWSLHLANFDLRRAALQVDDAAVAPATHLAVSPINLSLTNLDSDLTKPVGVRLDARMEGATLRLSGSATPAKGTGQFKVALSGLQMRTLLPYSPRLHDADVTSGEVSASGALHLTGRASDPMSFDGQAAIDRFNVRQPSTNGLLASWDSLRLQGLRYDARGATVERASLIAPAGRVVVMPDRTLNLAAVTGSANQQPQAAGGPSPAAPAATAPAAPAPSAAASPAVPLSSAPAQSAASASRPVPFTVKQLMVEGGTMEFADLSIDPNFQARIEALQGSLSNLSSQPDTIVAIDLTGQVTDRYSPVTIKGSLDPNGFDRQTDLHLTFRNIELPLFNPYSGRYAGYAIAKGKLTTELTYKIDHRMLKADHHVVIDQLRWGAATESKEKAPIPVRLATALLKDKDGVINLNVPVTGSMDDPKFKVWPIIWQVVRQTLEKAAVAPFRLIGGLFKGAEKAEFVDFEPGSASLPPDAGQALGSLGKALAQRHELSIDVPAGPGLAEDADALADQRIDKALLAQKGKPASAKDLSPGERLARMKVLYKAQFHQNPVFPPPAQPAAVQPVTAETAPAESTPAESAPAESTPTETVPTKTAPIKTALPKAARPKVRSKERKAGDLAWLQDRLRPAFKPSAEELQALGAARARAVRDALVAEGGVDPTQVFMTPQALPTAQDGRARLALKLQ